MTALVGTDFRGCCYFALVKALGTKVRGSFMDMNDFCMVTNALVSIFSPPGGYRHEDCSREKK